MTPESPLEFPLEEPVSAWRAALWKIFGVEVFNPSYRTYLHLRRLARQRNDKCEQFWEGNAHFMSVQKALRILIRKEMSWPNDFFIPRDPCKVVFFDPFPHMAVELALIKIEDYFSVTLDSEIYDKTLGELATTIVNAQQELGGSDPNQGGPTKETDPTNPAARCEVKISQKQRRH